MWSGFFLNAEIICNMNIFDIFHKTEYDSKIVLINESEPITLETFKKYVSVAIRFLDSNAMSKNAVILSERTFDFAIWFFACIYSGREIFFPSDYAKLQYLDFDFVKLEKFETTLLETFLETELYTFHKLEISNTFLNFYTSGSSGTPKHVRKTLKNAIAEAKEILKFLKNAKSACSIVKSSASPLHMFAFVFYFVLPLIALEKLTLDTDNVYYPDSVDFKKCIFVSTPSFLEKFKKYDIFCDAGIIFSAGAKLSKELTAYFEQKSYIVDIYGSTESGTIAYRDSAVTEDMTVLSGVKVSVDSNSQICVESPFFMENKLVLCDIIKMKNEKHFTLKNRSDRILKIQEKRVSAVEIEDFINNCDIVKECYCLKIFDKLACALVLDNTKLKNFFASDKKICKIKSLIEYLKKYLSDKTEILPQRWRFLHELPKTERGKIDIEKIEQIFALNLSLPLVTKYSANVDSAEFEMFFHLSCNFFEGHFNGFPILPGVVQMYFANYFASTAFDVKVRTDIVKKIKFSKLIKPEETVKLIFERKDNTINYRYEKDGHVCSNGVMFVDEKD